MNNIIDLRVTLESGQVFLWYEIKGNYYIIHGSNVLKARKDGDNLTYESRPSKVNVEEFFRLDDDMHKINNSIARDELVRKAIEEFYGLRLLRQEPFQCMISFILATNTSIRHITSMLGKLCRRFGACIELDGLRFYTFPDAKAIAEASINELCSCSLGYRARYVKYASNEYPSMDIEYIKRSGYNEARDILLSIPGIGSKVADCIMLFALEHLEAFPIDIWIARVLARYYTHIVKVKDRLTAKEYRYVADTMRAYFGIYAGYAQQYLYCYARKHLYDNVNKSNSCYKLKGP